MCPNNFMWFIGVSWIVVRADCYECLQLPNQTLLTEERYLRD